MWGQGTPQPKQAVFLRIIPTRVGTSKVICYPAHHSWDHPHACGDKADCLKTTKTRAGSSPRVWGQVRPCFGRFPLQRIIPTRVGTRTSQTHFRTLLKDHPHACGDKKVVLAVLVVVAGSSPRVWGQGKSLQSSAHGKGIIPTRVGTRRALYRSQSLWKDHPHACGDKIVPISSIRIIVGSSPRVWGQAACRCFIRR